MGAWLTLTIIEVCILQIRLWGMRHLNAWHRDRIRVGCLQYLEVV